MHVAVLYGGMSSEREVSLKSGQAVAKALENLNIKYSLIDVDRNVAQKLTDLKPDVAFNALHGTYGEDGAIQGLLEILNIPYTHSGVEASAICMNKNATNRILHDSGFILPQSELLSVQDIAQNNINLSKPLVIKPASEGSSVGVYIIHEDSDIPALKDIAKYGEMIVQEYIEGEEITCAVIDEKPLGVIQISTIDKFYNYKNKYTSGQSTYLCPADIPEDVYEYVQNASLKAHIILGCKAVSRSDFRYDPKTKKAYFLEINTHPGLTELSLLPKMAQYCGIEFDELIKYIIEKALENVNTISSYEP